MLRPTITKLLNEPTLNRRTVVQCIDAIHAKITPALTWVEKVHLIHKVHNYKSRKHEEWTVEKTSDFLQLNYFHVLESLRLYYGVRSYPNLRYIKNRKIAVKFLATSFPDNFIDEYMIINNIRKDDIKVTE